jgi:branched-chain amino acid transport system permease protein
MKKQNTTENKTNDLVYRLECFVEKYKLFLIILSAAFLIALPFLTDSVYVTRILTLICIYVVLGLSMNILSGQLGIMSLGQAGFMGVGAFTGAVLMTRFQGWQFLTAAPIAAIIAGFLGFIIGITSLRLSGAYLAIVTLGFGEIMRMVFLNWTPVTGGALGIRNIPKPVVFGMELSMANKGMYFLSLIIAILVGLLCWSLTKSKYGRAFYAIKQDDLASSLVGIEVTRYKILGFVISTMICGFIGVLYAQMQRFIDSNSFIGDMSILIVSVVVIGGMGTIRGPVIGAILLVTLPEVLQFMYQYRFIVYGALLVLMMIYRPSGLLGWQSPLPYKLPKGTEKILTATSNTSSQKTTKKLRKGNLV